MDQRLARIAPDFPAIRHIPGLSTMRLGLFALFRAFLSRHLLLCLAGAVFLFGATVHAQSADDPVRFLYWNVENYRESRISDDAFALSSPKPDEAISAVVERILLERPQVLLLCEVAGPESLQALQARLHAGNLDLPHSHLVQGPDAARCLAILSAFPIVAKASNGWVPFELDAEPLYMSRGFLDVTVELPAAERIRLVGCHLKSRLEHALGADELRRFEAWLLRQHLEKNVFPTGEPVIVWGDFNDDRSSVSFREIQGIRGSETYLNEARLADAAGERWTYLWEPADQYTRVDFFLVSHALRGRINEAASRVVGWPEWRVASDHRPLLLQLQPAAQQ